MKESIVYVVAIRGRKGKPKAWEGTAGMISWCKTCHGDEDGHVVVVGEVQALESELCVF